MSDAPAAFPVERPHAEHPIFEFVGADVVFAQTLAFPRPFVENDNRLHRRDNVRGACRAPTAPSRPSADVPLVPDYGGVVFPSGLKRDICNVCAQRLLAVFVFVNADIDAQPPGRARPRKAIFQPAAGELQIILVGQRIVLRLAVVCLSQIVRRAGDDQVGHLAAQCAAVCGIALKEIAPVRRPHTLCNRRPRTRSPSCYVHSASRHNGNALTITQKSRR